MGLSVDHRHHLPLRLRLSNGNFQADADKAAGPTPLVAGKPQLAAPGGSQADTESVARGERHPLIAQSKSSCEMDFIKTQGGRKKSVLFSRRHAETSAQRMFLPPAGLGGSRSLLGALGWVLIPFRCPWGLGPVATVTLRTVTVWHNCKLPFFSLSVKWKQVHIALLRGFRKMELRAFITHPNITHTAVNYLKK